MELTATVIFLNAVRLIPDYRGAWWESIAREVTEVSAKMWPSCPADALLVSPLAPAAKTG
jgi:hypothetical protein